MSILVFVFRINTNLILVLFMINTYLVLILKISTYLCFSIFNAENVNTRLVFILKTNTK